MNTLINGVYKVAAGDIFTKKEAAQMLASKHENDRRRILTERLERILSMPEEERVAAIGDMLEAEGELSDEDRAKVVKTRLEIFTEFPKEKRDILMGALKKVMSSWTGDRKIMERQAVLAATQDYFILKKMAIRAIYNRMLA